jgi:O-antigen/teichoic acid export membrane protein
MKLSSLVVAPGFSTAGVVSRFQANVFWNALAAAISQGSTFAATIIVANILGRATFGQYAIVVSTLVSAGFIAQFTGQAFTKYVAEYRATEKRRAGSILGFCFIVTAVSALLTMLIVIGFSPWIARYLLKSPSLLPALILGSIYLALSVFNGTLPAIFAGLEAYRAMFRVSVISGICTIVFCTYGGWHYGLFGAIAGLDLSAIIRILLFRLSLKRELAVQQIVISYRDWKEHLGILYRFILPNSFGNFCLGPSLWLGNAFLVRLSGYDQMAIYAASYNVYTAAMFLPLAMYTVGQSLINHRQGIGDEAGYRRVFWTNLAANFGVAAAISVFFVLFGPYVLRMFGKEFQQDAHAIKFLLAAAVPEALTYVLTHIPLSREKAWLSLLTMNIPRDILFVASAYILIGSRGAAGLALAFLISRLLGFASAVVVVACLKLDMVKRQNLMADAGVCGDAPLR